MVHVRSQSLIGNLTLAALLTINSFHFPFPHKISGGLDILLNLIVISHFVSFVNFIVISHFVFILGAGKAPEGNLFVIYDNES